MHVVFCVIYAGFCWLSFNCFNQDEDNDEPEPGADGEDQAGERLRGEQVHHQSPMLGAGDSDDDDPDYQNMSDENDMSNEESGRDPHFM